MNLHPNVERLASPRLLYLLGEWNKRGRWSRFWFISTHRREIGFELATLRYRVNVDKRRNPHLYYNVVL